MLEASRFRAIMGNQFSFADNFAPERCWPNGRTFKHGPALVGCGGFILARISALMVVLVVLLGGTGAVWFATTEHVTVGAAAAPLSTSWMSPQHFFTYYMTTPGLDAVQFDIVVGDVTETNVTIAVVLDEGGTLYGVEATYDRASRADVAIADSWTPIWITDGDIARGEAYLGAQFALYGGSDLLYHHFIAGDAHYYFDVGSGHLKRLENTAVGTIVVLLSEGTLAEPPQFNKPETKPIRMENMEVAESNMGGWLDELRTTDLPPFRKIEVNCPTGTYGQMGGGLGASCLAIYMIHSLTNYVEGRPNVIWPRLGHGTVVYRWSDSDGDRVVTTCTSTSPYVGVERQIICLDDWPREFPDDYRIGDNRLAGISEWSLCLDPNSTWDCEVKVVQTHEGYVECGGKEERCREV